MNKVLHFVRKKSQLRASFIRNQITRHVRYNPVTVNLTVDPVSKGISFTDAAAESFPGLELDKTSKWWERFLFRTLKRISNRQAMAINAFIQSQGVNVLHFHYGSDAGIYGPFLKRTTIPSVVSFYGYDCFSFPGRWFGIGRLYLKHRVFKNVNTVLAMSPEMKKDLIRAGCPEQKIRIHYHGIPSDIFTAYKKSYRTGKYTRLLTLSYLDPFKGHLFLLQSLLLLNQGDYELRIVGDGFFRKTLEEFVRNHDLESKVRFVGPIPYASDEFRSEYRKADIFIHPSITTRNDKEGIPGALVEAMFAGLPIISTFHGGIPCVIRDRTTGILVKEWDTGALADSIVRLGKDLRLRRSLGKAARTYAVQNLDLSDRQRALEKIYDECRID